MDITQTTASERGRLLLTEKIALTLMHLPNTRRNREWLARCVAYETAATPKRLRLYRRGHIEEMMAANITPP